jgi:hydroxymethylbilane synthase
MIIIGTRGSTLALAQTSLIKDKIRALFPDEKLSIRIISTSADRDLTASLRNISSAGVFIKELEQSLIAGEIDIAVHSMKDVPISIPEELHIAAIPEREDARDALIAADAKYPADLPEGATVGTGSFRRQSQLLTIRPDLNIVEIRGNIETRLKKTGTGTCDAVILACAGLRRLGLQERISSVFDYSQMLPAPGQGALAVEIRAGDAKISAIASALNHADTAIAVTVEREFLRRMGGGCNIPIAIYARIENGIMLIDGLVASTDGKRVIRESMQTLPEKSMEAVAAMSDRVLARGGREILAEFI